MEKFVKINNRAILPYVEMVVTSVCNMKCIDCSNNIPNIQNDAKHVSADEFSLQLSALTSIVDEVERFQIHGGEPLLNPDLPEIAQIAINEQALKKIRIATNGTIPLSSELIDVLSKNRITLSISNYWFNRNSRKRVVAQCENAGIPYILHEKQPWYSFSSKPMVNIMKYEECPINKYLCYYDWRLFLCARICHCSDNTSHSIDVRNVSDLQKELTSDKLKEWCRQCTICDKLVTAGIQSSESLIL